MNPTNPTTALAFLGAALLGAATASATVVDKPAAAAPAPISAAAIESADHVTFDQLVGVARDDAIHWAINSGFAVIVDTNTITNHPMPTTPTQRIAFTFNNGVVSAAIAG